MVLLYMYMYFIYFTYLPLEWSDHCSMICPYYILLICVIILFTTQKFMSSRILDAMIRWNILVIAFLWL